MAECKILIADDEKLAREAVKLQLQDIENILIFEAANGKEAGECILEQRPDIVFLDIQMPVLTGLEVLDKLSNDYQPFVIIVTAYDMYALQAFDNNAIDYLLKPFTDERFLKAFNKAFQMWKQRNNLLPTVDAGLPNQLKQILAQLNNVSRQSTITIKDGSKIFILRLDDIMYIEAAGDYLSVVTLKRNFCIRILLRTSKPLYPLHYLCVSTNQQLSIAPL
jgi:two-component system LytT family response regulator